VAPSWVEITKFVKTMDNVGGGGRVGYSCEVGSKDVEVACGIELVNLKRNWGGRY